MVKKESRIGYHILSIMKICDVPNIQDGKVRDFILRFSYYRDAEEENIGDAYLTEGKFELKNE